ncbi:carbohydrate-binding protein [Galbitalea soli]|uniref:Carbohydrate-binding protein n=1 Tax=Galbitalea soli TaxID=1268042 RepID=A0A7C9TRT9_9MICO|nr:CBM35 domain-containing protein [Galbitalea soli]NEM91861.1 carbohydrate-binding protein [Galbitalea soli]NYJ29303.1 hypothetical protein [Galbitalea soli]
MKHPWLPAIVASAALILATATPAAAANPVITVYLSTSTGAVTHDSSGFLYGIANAGIPTDSTIAALHPDSTAQMAPAGTQHPNGDALKVAPQFLADGGSDILVYMQDYYSTWPYPTPGITSYLNVVAAEANAIVADPNRAKYIYVPFNEPDQQWYSGNLSGLEADWKLVYQKIRSIDPTARIAGLNYSGYSANDYANFLSYAKANNVLPDVTTWHELQNSFFTDWYSNYSTYRAAESNLGITPRPIYIDEYGRINGDLGVPGNLVQYIARFENSKVHANLAFWTDSGSLNDLVAANSANQVTGGWWLYKWYGELTGNTVSVTPPSQNGSLQAIGAYDSSKKQARIILGGSLNSTDVFSSDVAVKNIPQALGNTVHATVWGVDNSGTAASAGPYVVTEGNYAVSAGSTTISLSGLKALSAYEIILTPNTATNSIVANRYEAEYASLTGTAKVTYGSNTGYSGTYFVEGYGASNNAGTNFVVNAPSDGYYNVALRYSAGPYSGAPTNRTTRLVLNGTATQDVALPGTANWNTWNSVTTKLYLQAGINRIGYNAFTTDDSDAINIDYIDVAATTGQIASYEAESTANTLGGTAVVSSSTGASGGKYVGYIGQGSGNSLQFNGVTATAAGSYALVIQYANDEFSTGGAGYNTNSINRFADISVNGGTATRVYFRVTGSWSTFLTAVATVQLNAGANTVKFTNSSAYAPDIDKLSIASIVG